MHNRILRQNPRDFTVRIKHADTGNTVGTGILVSSEGMILTCAHVVEDAGADPRQKNGVSVGVFFPKLGSKAAEEHRAVVKARFPEHDDDVVLLQIKEDPIPRDSSQVAVLGDAELSDKSEFESYGYRKLEDYIAGRADGIIQGSVDPPEDRRLQADPIQLKTSQINRGMSGAGVLDIDRNLVVGLISETWFPDQTMKDFDTAWAVNVDVVRFAPLNLPIRNDSLPLRELVPKKKFPLIEKTKYDCDLRLSLQASAPPLSDAEWVGRKILLEDLGTEWKSNEHSVIGLIGFGGEGKTSIVRRWIDILLSDDSQPKPAQLFWWDFNANPSVDAFLGAAVACLGGEDLMRRVKESSVRVNLIGALLQQQQRFLFVLDALESIQNAKGDNYGYVHSPFLKELLRIFATPGHQSLSIITSRIPLFDIGNFRTYRHINVIPLELAEGRMLLQKLGVKGSEAELDQVVNAWEGHALTLSLLGSYLAEKFQGSVQQASRFSPDKDENPYGRIHLLLDRYHEQLSAMEKTLIMILSAYRSPVSQRTLKILFHPEQTAESITGPLCAMDESDFEKLLDHLRALSILRFDTFSTDYTIHPLIREYFYQKLTDDQRKEVHTRLKELHLFEANVCKKIRKDIEKTIDAPVPPFGWIRIGDAVISSHELQPLIEAFYHACKAGDLDEAYGIYFHGIQEGNWSLVRQQGAFELDLKLLSNFFVDGDHENQLLVRDQAIQSRLINQVGFDFKALGNPTEAVRFFQQSSRIDRETGDMMNAFWAQLNQTETLVQVGSLNQAKETTGGLESLANLTREMSEQNAFNLKMLEISFLAVKAWVAHLRGQLADASEAFRTAEALQIEREPHVQHLYSMGGIWLAAHLIAIGDIDSAEAVNSYNAHLCEQSGFIHNVVACYKLQGDILRKRSELDGALEFYNAAVSKAEEINLRYELSWSLCGRGTLHLARGAFKQASDDLLYGQSLCEESIFRLFQADILNAISLLKMSQNRPSTAKKYAEQALVISQDTSYYWGAEEAKKLLGELRSGAGVGPH